MVWYNHVWNLSLYKLMLATNHACAVLQWCPNYYVVHNNNYYNCMHDDCV